MSVYERPVWRDPSFRDTAGAVVEYGSRWGEEGPPPDTYSVDTHSERFAPLHVVADALIVHLTATYDVRDDHDPANAADFVLPTDFLRVTRLTPADPAAAPLTFGFTAYPGVVLHAGLLHDFTYPDCGCDACDETAAGQADLLEWHVLAVAAGNYVEKYTPGTQLPVAFSIRMADELGSQGGQAQASVYSKDRLSAAGERLRKLPNGWAAWPQRA